MHGHGGSTRQDLPSCLAVLTVLYRKAGWLPTRKLRSPIFSTDLTAAARTDTQYLAV